MNIDSILAETGNFTNHILIKLVWSRPLGNRKQHSKQSFIPRLTLHCLAIDLFPSKTHSHPLRFFRYDDKIRFMNVIPRELSSLCSAFRREAKRIMQIFNLSETWVAFNFIACKSHRPFTYSGILLSRLPIFALKNLSNCKR